MAPRLSRLSLEAMQLQLRLQAIQTQLDAAFTYCSTAENALLFHQIKQGQKAVGHARHVAHKTRKHIAEPHHVPEASLPSLKDTLSKLDAKIASIEAALS